MPEKNHRQQSPEEPSPLPRAPDTSAEEAAIAEAQKTITNAGPHALTATLKAAYDALNAASSSSSGPAAHLSAAAAVLSRMMPEMASNNASTHDPNSRKRPLPSDSPSSSGQNTPSKPSPGTAEWLRQKKMNHAQIEKKRREMINEGMNELATLLPNMSAGQANKGMILKSAVSYIQHLKDESDRNQEKWNMEKMFFEQAIAELTGQVETLTDENNELKKKLKN